MNLKDLIVPLIVAIAVTFGLNYFFADKVAQKNIETERSRIAPKIEEINLPLNFEIDFLDEDMQREAKIDVIETQFAQFTFSSLGAALDKVAFKHDVSKDVIMMPTIEATGKEDKCFLLAFEEKTPLNYKLIESTQNDTAFKLVYQTEKPFKIVKEFTIYKHKPQVDLEIDITALENSAIRARLLYPSPYVAGLKDEVVKGLVNDGKSVAKKNIDVVKEGRYWEAPTLFGAEDRYFIHTMTADSNNFTQRAYFKIDGESNRLTTILDSGNIKSNGAYTLSFYFGPKRVALMQSVDARLTGILEYGWLEPLCIPTMYVLNKFYDYVKNYGWAIVLLTILMKLLLLPFAWRGQSRMKDSAKKQKEMQAKLNYIKEKYKDDKERLQLEQAELIKKHGLPGFGGCLPLLVQLPLFFALQRVLYNSVELYKAKFLWIPDLSASDPYYILPVIVALGMIAGGVGMPQSKGSFDPRTKLVQVAFGLIIGAIMINLSSGLVLYIALSSLLTMLQNVVQTRFQRA